jgi:hypothetical protein
MVATVLEIFRPHLRLREYSFTAYVAWQLTVSTMTTLAAWRCVFSFHGLDAWYLLLLRWWSMMLVRAPSNKR